MVVEIAVEVEGAVIRCDFSYKKGRVSVVDRKGQSGVTTRDGGGY